MYIHPFPHTYIFMACTGKALHHQLTNFLVNAVVKSIYSQSLLQQHPQLASNKVYEQKSPITRYTDLPPPSTYRHKLR